MISVLYVDDEPDLLELCRIFLEQSGDIRVETTPAPLEVIPLMKTHEYQAIICDYQMPDMDGITLLKEIRKDGCDIPFILFTGRGREEVVIEALNNGADFYLQKGGDIRAQFTELASKVRQAILRRQAQQSLRESEKLLFDIINFLPDATLAINREGVIIAWNRAVEEMTGVPAREMAGRGNYEYALPFYGERRPMLIDLIFEPEESLRQNYSDIRREGDVLIAETDLPRPKGVHKVLTGRASPLYNESGEIVGAIESIRDVTEQKHAEDELRAAHEELTASDEELRAQYEELVRAETDIRAREEQLLAITTGIPGVVYQFVLQPGGIAGMHFVSERSRDILGIEPDTDDFFERFTAHVLPDDRDGFLDSIEKVRINPRTWHHELRFIRPSGEQIWLEGLSQPSVHGNELIFSGVIIDITQRKKIEDALREEGEKYRTLVEHSQDPVFIVQDANLVFANTALTKLTGYTEEEIIGRPIRDLIAPEDRELAVTRNRERMEGKSIPESYALSILHADGTTRIRVLMNVGIATYRGRPASIGTFHTITEEGHRNDALARSEKKYRELAELLPQMVFEMDATMRITYANRFALECLGFTDDDIKEGIRAIDYIDPSQHHGIMEGIQKMLAGEPAEPREYTALRKDGSTLPVRIYSSPIITDGVLTGYRGVIIDISAWKTETKARMEIENLYSSLADAAQDIIFIIDRNDNVTYVNHYGLQMLGKTPEEIIGKKRKNLFPDPFSARQYQSLQRVFSTGRPFRIESCIPLEGRDTWQDTHLVPLRQEGGTVRAVLGISRDISQLKLTEVALKRSNEKLNLLNSITRHDVANQLTILNGYIQLARMKEPDPVIVDFLHKIETACQTIQRQIEFTREYQDLGIRAPDWHPLDEIIARTRPSGIVFTTLCNHYEVFADPMLEKVFFNLFDNAIRHGERVTSIAVRCEIAGDELTIVIEDDGTGIPLDAKQKIFQKGFGKNTGYGLFLVREILAITGIVIHETGRYGNGARFEVTVPRGGFRIRESQSDKA